MSVEARIDGTLVELPPNEFPAFTYRIGDQFDPGRIKGSRSTEWNIPATNSTRAGLGSAVMSENVGSSNHELVIGNAGQVYLKNTIRVTEWDRDEIRAVAVGNNASWISDMRAKKIQQMDLGSTGAIDAALIQGSWTDEELMYLFPLIDYGYDWSTTTLGALIENIRPGIRCHRLIAQAFDELGYSVKVSGGLNRVWKKFILPATQDVVLAADYLAGNTMSLNMVNGPVLSPVTNIPILDPSYPWPDVVPFPPQQFSVSDPGGNNTNTYYYTTPFEMHLRIRFQIEFSPTQPFAGETALYFYAFRTDTQELLAPATQFSVGGQTMMTFDLNLADLTIAAGVEVGVSIAMGAPYRTFAVASCTVTYEVAGLEYQEGVSVDLAKSGPKMSVMDVIKGIALSKNIAIDTNDATRQVTFSYVDDKYKSPNNGKSLIGREDHTDPPVKSRELLPRRVLFLWQEDDDDQPLTDLNKEIGERGWGGYIKEIEGGVLDDTEIELPFAATRMKMYPGSVFIPVIRTTEDEHDPQYKWQPRLLIHDGLGRGEWTLEGVAQEQYPKCFFVHPEIPEHGLSFYPEDKHGNTGPGAFDLRWAKYFRRFEHSFVLEIDLMLYDDELLRTDFGTPVEAHDGKMAGWYYFEEIKQKRFGIHEPTRCKLVQV